MRDPYEIINEIHKLYDEYWKSYGEWLGKEADRMETTEEAMRFLINTIDCNRATASGGHTVKNMIEETNREIASSLARRTWNLFMNKRRKA